MKKKVTLKDIANELNVTVGTVSHVLNGIDDISAETKERVLKAAKEMGYISNAAAASLRSGKTNTVAIIVPDISNPHLAYQLKQIEDRMKEKRYSVIIFNTNEDEEAEYQAITVACGKQVDGILLCPCQQSDQNICFLNGTGIPYVLIGRFFAAQDTDYVCADDEKGGYLAGKHLLASGCRKPLYIGAYRYIETSGLRFEGLRRAFEEQGVPLSKARFVEISPKTDASVLSVERLWDAVGGFDSLVVFSDILAFQVMAQVKKLGLAHIPVIGFDAIQTHLPIPFSYASVGMKNGGWADEAAAVLLEKMKGSNERCQQMIDVALYEFRA